MDELKTVRVLNVIPNIADAGGAERMVIDLTRGLCELGVNARLLNLYPYVECDLAVYAERLGVDVIYGRKRTGFDPRVYVDTLKCIRAQRSNIIHSHLYVLRYLLPILFLPYLRGVHSIHNQPEREGRRDTRSIQRLLFKFRRSIPVAVGPSLGPKTASYYGLDQVVEIPNGVDTAQFNSVSTAQRDAVRLSLGISDDTCLILCVGRLTPQKEPLRVIDTFVRAKDSARGKAILAFAGDGELRESVKREAARVFPPDSVRLLGRRSDLPQLYAAADIVLSLSSYEGAPLSLVEAMAASLPVVATDVGAVASLVTDDAGILIDPNSIDKAVVGLRQLIDDPHLRRNLGAAGHQRAQQFDVSLMARRYLELYRTLVSA